MVFNGKTCAQKWRKNSVCSHFYVCQQSTSCPYWQEIWTRGREVVIFISGSWWCQKKMAQKSCTSKRHGQPIGYVAMRGGRSREGAVFYMNFDSVFFFHFNHLAIYQFSLSYEIALNLIFRYVLLRVSSYKPASFWQNKSICMMERSYLANRIPTWLMQGMQHLTDILKQI